MKIGSAPQGVEIMANKAVFKVIKLENIAIQDAIIIKQDMLSIGGEVAVPHWVFDFREKRAEILVMGTVKQLNELVKKLDRHYLRIKNISKELSFLLKEIR